MHQSRRGLPYSGGGPGRKRLGRRAVGVPRAFEELCRIRFRSLVKSWAQSVSHEVGASKDEQTACWWARKSASERTAS